MSKLFLMYASRMKRIVCYDEPRGTRLISSSSECYPHWDVLASVAFAVAAGARQHGVVQHDSLVQNNESIVSEYSGFNRTSIHLYVLQQPFLCLFAGMGDV